MKYTPISPFMRRISHAHLRVVERSEAAHAAKPVSKWELLRDLSKAQAAFGISDRDLTVLQGLLSFFPGDTLGGDAEMVVFPSNKAICERLNGMACSTMRRHLARLVAAGLLMRRDSPNGKRYSRRHGAERVTFGFDLLPLHCRAEEIARAAEAVRERDEQIRRLRETVSLMRRDLAALAAFGEEIYSGHGLWDQLRETATLTASSLRRKLVFDELACIRDTLERLLDQARNIIDGVSTEEMGTSGAHSEQHYHNSNIDTVVLEPALEKGGTAGREPEDADQLPVAEHEDLSTHSSPKIPLHLVISACPELKIFYPGEIRHWHQLHDAACHVRPAMGISVSAWEEARRHMGPEQASIVLAAILQRFEHIRSPGGYLRALTTKAAAGEFSCGPMVMALIARRDAA